MQKSKRFGRGRREKEMGGRADEEAVERQREELEAKLWPYNRGKGMREGFLVSFHPKAVFLYVHRTPGLATQVG